MFGPTLIMDVRYGYIRYAGGHSPRTLGYDIGQLGFSSSVTDQLTQTADMFPRVAISGAQSLGSESADTSTTMSTPSL